MIKREAKWNIVFNHWIKEKYKRTACFELKQTETLSLPFSSVKDHQIAALLAASNKGLVFKIPDGSFSPSPFDCFSMFGVPAFVVIKYPASFEMITIDNFLHARDTSIKKSLTYNQAKKISSISINI